MENEVDNTMLQGFSHRAQSEEFREEVKDSQKKHARKGIIFTLVFLALTLICVVSLVMFANGVETEAMAWISVIAMAGVPICGIITIIMAISTLLGHINAKRGLGKDSWDGVVLEKKHWVSTTTDEDGNTTEHDNYRITIEKPDGKHFKLKDIKAKAFLPYVEQGDRVRYHPGFPYPLELFDKSKHLSNICVFCGTRNDARNGACTKCGKPMLI